LIKVLLMEQTIPDSPARLRLVVSIVYITIIVRSDLSMTSLIEP